MFTFDDSVLWRCCDYVLDAGVGVDDCSSFPVFEDDIDNNNGNVLSGGMIDIFLSDSSAQRYACYLLVLRRVTSDKNLQMIDIQSRISPINGYKSIYR